MEYGFMTMPGVDIIGFLLIGIAAGFVAEKVMKADHGLLTNLLVGVAGSFIGGIIAGALGVAFFGWLGNFVVACVGAILLLYILRMVRK